MDSNEAVGLRDELGELRAAYRTLAVLREDERFAHSMRIRKLRRRYSERMMWMFLIGMVGGGLVTLACVFG